MLSLQTPKDFGDSFIIFPYLNDAIIEKMSLIVAAVSKQCGFPKIGAWIVFSLHALKSRLIHDKKWSEKYTGCKFHVKDPRHGDTHGWENTSENVLSLNIDFKPLCPEYIAKAGSPIKKSQQSLTIVKFLVTICIDGGLSHMLNSVSAIQNIHATLSSMQSVQMAHQIKDVKDKVDDIKEVFNIIQNICGKTTDSEELLKKWLTLDYSGEKFGNFENALKRSNKLIQEKNSCGKCFKPLKLKVKILQNYKCDVCGVVESCAYGSYHCMLCNFDECRSCGDSDNNRVKEGFCGECNKSMKLAQNMSGFPQSCSICLEEIKKGVECYSCSKCIWNECQMCHMKHNSFKRRSKLKMK